MEGRDLASNLEFWSGRARHGGAGEDPRPRRRSFRRGSFRGWSLRPSLRFPALRPARDRSGSRPPRGRARPVAAFALLAGLTAAWVVAGHRSHPSAVGDVARALPALSSVTPSTIVSSSTAATTTTVPRTRDCRGLSPTRREVRCVIDGIELDVQLFAPEAVAAAYRRATGVAGAGMAARSGPPACARGLPDERAWSAVASPATAAGRYQCRIERGRAAMWWTRGVRLEHAVARDGDLAALFSWWRTHPSE